MITAIMRRAFGRMAAVNRYYIGLPNEVSSTVGAA